jgi:kynurenine formamidase
MMMSYVHMDPQYGGNPVQPEELAHAHDDDNVNVVVGSVIPHHALMAPVPMTAQVANVSVSVPPPPVSMQSPLDEFVEVTSSDGCDIAWRSCGMYLRSLEKINGKFRAKCVCCGAIIPGRIYRLIRHVESECQMIRPDIKDKYLSDLIDTGKDYGQRGGRIVNNVKKRMNGEMVSFGAPGGDNSFGDASGLGDSAELALFLHHQNGDDKTPRKKRPRKSSTGSAMKVLESSGLCIPIVNIREDFSAVDLTYPLDAESTIFWPGSGPEGFRLCMNCYSNPQQGFEYYAGTFNCAEHSGTHVDAPYHFNKDGMTVDNLSLSHLMGPVVVIDIKHKMHPIEINGNYALHAEDIIHFEAQHGMLKPGTMVIVRTGWSKFYPLGPKAYLGYDEKSQGPYIADMMPLSFPGIGEDAARLFVDRRVAAVGIDTASLDPGYVKDFIAHRILLSAGIYGIENLSSDVERLPYVGANLQVFPMKIKGGSGAPARVVALVNKV